MVVFHLNAAIYQLSASYSSRSIPPELNRSTMSASWSSHFGKWMMMELIIYNGFFLLGSKSPICKTTYIDHSEIWRKKSCNILPWDNRSQTRLEREFHHCRGRYLRKSLVPVRRRFPGIWKQQNLFYHINYLLFRYIMATRPSDIWLSWFYW